MGKGDILVPLLYGQAKKTGNVQMLSAGAHGPFHTIVQDKTSHLILIGDRAEPWHGVVHCECVYFCIPIQQNTNLK